MPLGLVDLLAARLIAGVGRVQHRDDDLLRAARACRASVMSKLKRVVAAAVGAQLLAVDPDRGLPIDRAEVQQHPLAGPGGGQLERAAIPECFVTLHHARQGRLDRKRHQDLLRGTRPAAGQRACRPARTATVR